MFVCKKSSQGLVLLSAMLLQGCLFLPGISEFGYVSCESNSDCEPGRSCEQNYCAPPPWNDDTFTSRNLITVENLGSTPLEPGTAIAVRFAEDGVLSTEDLGPDGQFSYFTDIEGALAAGSWEELPAFFDVYSNELIVSLPLQQSVAPGAVAQLAWLESSTATNDANVLLAPDEVFMEFEDFDDPLDEERFKTFGTGEPNLRDGLVNVGDNQKLVFDRALTPPFSLTLTGRLNGASCEALYIGLEGDNNAGYSAPSTGLFAISGLTANAEVAPEEDSIPQPVVQGIALDTGTHRYRFDVGSGQVKMYIDDVVVAEPDVRPPMSAPDGLFAVVDVDGDCSFDLDRIMVSPLPIEGVAVSGAPRVNFQGFN